MASVILCVGSATLPAHSRALLTRLRTWARSSSSLRPPAAHFSYVSDAKRQCCVMAVSARSISSAACFSSSAMRRSMASALRRLFVWRAVSDLTARTLLSVLWSWCRCFWSQRPVSASVYWARLASILDTSVSLETIVPRSSGLHGVSSSSRIWSWERSTRCSARSLQRSTASWMSSLFSSGFADGVRWNAARLRLALFRRSWPYGESDVVHS